LHPGHATSWPHYSGATPVELTSGSAAGGVPACACLTRQALRGQMSILGPKGQMSMSHGSEVPDCLSWPGSVAEVDYRHSVDGAITC